MLNTYSGTQFNALARGKKFVKILNREEIHFGFHYKTGLNKDIIQFNPHQCCAGGLYFTEFENAHLYFEYGPIIRWVTIPDEAQVYVEGQKFKADMFTLSEPIDFTDETNIEYFMSQFDKAPLLALQYFVFPPKQILINALVYDDLPINLVSDSTGRTFIEALDNSKHLCLIDDENVAPNKENKICKYIQYFENMPQEFYFEALKIYPSILAYIKNPSRDMYIKAIAQDYTLIRFIEESDTELIFLAIQEKPCAIEYVKGPTLEMCLEVVSRDGLLIRYIQDPPLEVSKVAIKQNWGAIAYIDTITREMALEATRQNPDCIIYVENPTIDLMLDVVKRNGNSVRFINDPPFSVCVEAVKQNREALNFIPKNYGKYCMGGN